jgi:hypothetical protein
MTTPMSPTQGTDLCHCGHTEEQHDAVAARFCRATLSEVLRRGCACRVGAPEASRSYDRR